MDCEEPDDKKGKSKPKKSKTKNSKPKNSKPKSDSDDKTPKSDSDSDSDDSDDSNDNDSESDSGSFQQFGKNESANIAKFLQSMTEKNYAEANKYLKAVVNLKIANQIRNTI